MNIELGTSTLKLAPEGMLRLRDAKGSRLLCENGILWITQEGRSEDVILRKGESLRLRHNGLTLAMALRPSELRVVDSKPLGLRAIAQILQRWTARPASVQATAC
jgi:hypothetical protein